MDQQLFGTVSRYQKFHIHSVFVHLIVLDCTMVLYPFHVGCISGQNNENSQLIILYTLTSILTVVLFFPNHLF